MSDAARRARVPSPGAVVVGVLVLAAFVHALLLRWSADDAFISFRYARNLVRGLGLVFNAGERVEGYTNFTWTLLAAAALRASASPEQVAWAAGALAHTGTVFLLGRGALREGRAWPVAAAAFALDPDAAAFATSGLETGLFTFLAVAAFEAWSSRRLGLAGVLLGLATATRPDGAVFAGALLVATVAAERRAFATAARAVARLAIGLVIVAGAHLAFRFAYYGELVPNTYYAKSGGLSWYAQGFHYLALFLLRHPGLAVAPIALAAVVRVPRARCAAWLGLAYAFWVVRVGGDFMFARFLVPATPFLLVVLERGIDLLRRQRPRSAAASATALVLSTPLLPCPVGTTPDRGIVDERAFYDDARVARTHARSTRMREALAGTDARVAFYGAQARLVYEADVPVAVESHTGLTDRFVARQPLAARGRVGHEKHAPPSYLIDVRAVDLALPSPRRAGTIDLVPDVRFDLGDVEVRLLAYRPAIVDTLRARGVAVPDVPSLLDAELASLAAMPPAVRGSEARAALVRAERFYFRWVDDAPRRARYAELAR